VTGEKPQVEVGATSTNSKDTGNKTKVAEYLATEDFALE
jgi:hypothetical protein